MVGYYRQLCAEFLLADRESTFITEILFVYRRAREIIAREVSRILARNGDPRRDTAALDSVHLDVPFLCAPQSRGIGLTSR